MLSYWVGLGGGGSYNGGPNQLAQAGIEGDMNRGAASVYPWVECTGTNGAVRDNPVQVNQMGIGQGSHVYTRIYTTSFEIGNIGAQTFDTWSSNGAYCWLTSPTSGGTASASPTSMGLDGATHDYAAAYWQFIQQPADQFMNVGEILSDPGDYPYDEYETTWIEACPGSCA